VTGNFILGEMYLGVLTLPDARKRARLQAWFDALAQVIEPPCVPSQVEGLDAGMDPLRLALASRPAAWGHAASILSK
jgi:hypothetical protein